MLGRAWDLVKKVGGALGTALKVTAGLLRGFAAVGNGYFGGKKTLGYFTHTKHNDSPITHPFLLFNILSSLLYNMLTRIPAMMRPAPPTAAPADAVADADADADAENNIQDNIDQIHANENPDEQAASNTHCGDAKYSTMLRILFHLSAASALAGVGLGSFNGGLELLSLFASPNSEWPLEYHLCHVAALLMALSNVYSFHSFVTGKASASFEALLDYLTNPNATPINFKVGSLAGGLAMFSVFSSFAFNFISCRASLEKIADGLTNFPLNHDNIIKFPDYVTIPIAVATGAGSLIMESATVIPALYNDFMEFNVSINNQEIDTPLWKNLIKAAAFPIGISNSGLSALNSLVSIALTSHTLFGSYPYGYAVLVPGIPFCLSKFFTTWSFDYNVGIKGTIGDIARCLPEKEKPEEESSSEQGVTINVTSHTVEEAPINERTRLTM